MEPDRAVADLERFLAERGDHLLRTAALLAGGPLLIASGRSPVPSQDLTQDQPMAPFGLTLAAPRDQQPQIRSYPVTMPLAEATASWAARVRRRARNP
jgi:hypothetical protein